MFVTEEERLDVGFSAARVRLANMLRSAALTTSSAECYEQGLVQVRPPGSAPHVSKLIKVHFGELAIREDSARSPLRWMAPGPEGGPFPALDADLELTALGADATVLSLAGAYRPPLGKAGAVLDQAVLRRAATVTISAFVRRVADAIVHPAGAPEPGGETRPV
jgi:hypothetical protein